MSYRKPLIGLVIFTSLAVVLTGMVLVTLRRDIAGPTNTYSAIFTDVSGLHAGDDVRVAGVRVGRVDRVELHGILATVAFRVQKDQALYDSTVASVIYQNIIGQRYLGLSPGPNGPHEPLQNHGEIPLARTTPSFDIAYLLNGFEPLFALLDPTQVDNLTEGIVQALQGNSGSILTLITQTSYLAETFAGRDQVLGDLIANLNAVMTNLAGQNANLQKVIRRTRDIMVELGNRRQQLVVSTGSINATLAKLATVTDAVYPDLHEMLSREPGFTGHLAGDGKARFAYLGANLPYLLKGAARISQEGSRANIYVCDLNVTVFAFLGRLIPSIVQRATPGGAVQHSPICR
ncbi:mammalian cell entry protein [Mycobacteroides chelonae]|uniref:Mammalian cell entry protein n=1 Tax=Mycobacteroides chelonae TaxID=1774 RepID=A0A1S1LZS6_MYCCH|nr:MCE family protein [Mycobacteroides chelonae]OHU55726.1 mammalian cell entry protein [Mycobacteroides chelonae]OHU75803.1 mammalian cell entry protein [Mycobacteroides chelonae]PKQ58163.1 mammalian cell entry protein [Mycobacterium sp. MHSD3]